VQRDAARCTRRVRCSALRRLRQVVARAAAP